MSDWSICECCQRPLFEGVAKKVMEELLNESPLTESQLAERIGVSSSAIFKAVDRLMKGPACYVNKERHPQAKNVKLISLDEAFLLSIQKEIKP